MDSMDPKSAVQHALDECGGDAEEFLRCLREDCGFDVKAKGSEKPAAPKPEPKEDDDEPASFTSLREKGAKMIERMKQERAN